MSGFMQYLVHITRRFRTPFLVLIIVGVSIGVTGCTGIADSEQSIQRPLHLPMLASGATCPRMIEHKIFPSFGLALGDGPVYPVGDGPWKHGIFYFGDARADDGWYYLKVLWVGSPQYHGPILIRGHQIDGPNELRFSKGIGSSGDATLFFPTSSEGYSPGGWTSWPSYMRVTAPGCYAYQVDGTSFSEVIVFQALKAPTQFHWAR